MTTSNREIRQVRTTAGKAQRRGHTRKISLLWGQRHHLLRKDCRHDHINIIAAEAGRIIAIITLVAEAEMVDMMVEAEGAADGDPGVARIAV
jgi:hypothetical protein